MHLTKVRWTPKVGQDRQPKVRRTISVSKKGRQHSPDVKARVGLEALKGIEPIHAIAAKYQVHPVHVSQWKKETAERMPEVFSRKTDHDAEAAKEREKILFEEIRRLKMKLEWLKKSWRARTLRSAVA